MLVEDLAGGLLQVADASVIPETFPKFENCGFLGSSQMRDGGQPFHPSIPIRNHGLHLRLLQHDFGDPDGVWVIVFFPGQVFAAVVVEPLQQVFGELFVGGLGRHVWARVAGDAGFGKPNMGHGVVVLVRGQARRLSFHTER